MIIIIIIINLIRLDFMGHVVKFYNCYSYSYDNFWDMCQLVWASSYAKI